MNLDRRIRDEIDRLTGDELTAARATTMWREAGANPHHVIILTSTTINVTDLPTARRILATDPNGTYVILPRAINGRSKP